MGVLARAVAGAMHVGDVQDREAIPPAVVGRDRPPSVRCDRQLVRTPSGWKGRHRRTGGDIDEAGRRRALVEDDERPRLTVLALGR